MLDFLIINGRVIDPGNDVDEIKPIAIYNGQIVEYEEEPARYTIDAKGKYILPGLIDAHAHMFPEGTDVGIYPDISYLPTGVTSAIDLSTGISNYRIFRSSIIEKSKITIKSFLQMSSAGLATTSFHENINPKYFNEKKIEYILRENSDNILGLKIRQSEDIANGLGIEPLKKTIEIANRLKCIVEVHCTNIPVPSEEILKILRPGDIFEHVYQGVKNTIIDSNGKLIPCVNEARKRGIIFDSAEGRKHGDFEVMQKAMDQGFIADICSTDLVFDSVFKRSIFSLPNLMSRYICMGIPFNQVVKMSTYTPAKLMKMEDKIGQLSIGSNADIAIFDWIDFNQTYYDWEGKIFRANKLLKPLLTIKDGDLVYCAPDYIYDEKYS